MGGFLNLFKNIKKSADASAQKAADKLDEKNAVEFAKQDIEKAKGDLRTIKGNIGTIKGEIATIQDNLDSVEAQIKKHDEDAQALMNAGKEALAEQHAEKAEVLEPQAKSLRTALDTQKTLLAKQQETKRKLEMNLQQMESESVTLKALNDAASANEKLATISTATGSNAVSSFKERTERARKRLIKSEAIADDSNENTDLEKATEEALGTGGAKARLERLKNKTT